jgi:hypothetical protein
MDTSISTEPKPKLTVAERVMLGTGLALVTMVTSTALFGTEEQSARAFRLLRMLSGRGEKELPRADSDE